MGQKLLEGREMETGLCHSMTGKGTLSSALNRYLFQIREG